MLSGSNENEEAISHGGESAVFLKSHHWAN